MLENHLDKIVKITISEHEQTPSSGVWDEFETDEIHITAECCVFSIVTFLELEMTNVTVY